MDKKKILVADDDPAITEGTKLILESAGYEVETTCNEETLDLVFKYSPDLMLLDIKMSGANGQEICRYLKSKNSTKGLPIILVSANMDVEAVARKEGADDFLSKPFGMNELLTKAANLVN